MPYIKRADRQKFHEEGIPSSLYMAADTAGELNYFFTVAAIDYFKRNGGNYQAINDVVGALEGAKLEFARRLASPYEDKKILENGDVYPKQEAK